MALRLPLAAVEAAQANAHKHKGEKTVQIETIVNYLRVFYNAASAYAVYVIPR